MKTIIEMDKEIEEIRNTLEDVDFQKSTLSQMSELNKYIEILTLERMSNQLKEFEKMIEEELRECKIYLKTNPINDYWLGREIVLEKLLTKIRGKK